MSVKIQRPDKPPTVESRSQSFGRLLEPQKKQLLDCRVLVLNREAIYKELIERKLAGKCKELVSALGNVPLVRDFEGERLLSYAIETTRDVDIAIITFYRHNEISINELIRILRSSNPTIYVVVVSSDSDDVERGVADIIIEKGEVIQGDSDTLVRKLNSMLANPPLQLVD